MNDKTFSRLTPELIDAAQAAVEAAQSVQSQRLAAAPARKPAPKVTPGESFLHSGAAHNTPVPVLNAAGLADLIRFNGTPYGGDDFSPEAPPAVGLLPGVGGRVASRVTTIPTDGRIHTAIESAAVEAAGKTPFGSNLPESSVSFTEGYPSFDRVGSYVSMTEGVFTDKGEGSRVVNAFIARDVLREVDAYILTDGTHGLFTSSAVPTAAKTGSRFDSIVSAATKVRGNGHDGIISVVLNPVDHTLALTERATDGERCWVSEILKDLGVEVVNTSVAPSGSAVVADLASAVTLFVKSPGLLLLSTESHSTSFLSSIITVSGSFRAYGNVQRPSGAVKITGF